MQPQDLISVHFTWKEAMWLPSWNRMGNQMDGFNDVVSENLKQLFKKMDFVRDYFGSPIRVHVAWRPDFYNKIVKGAPGSAHVAGAAGDAACDFDVVGISCDEARSKIIQDKKLEEWNMRMEDNPGSNWVHLDIRKPALNHPRFFKP